MWKTAPIPLSLTLAFALSLILSPGCLRRRIAHQGEARVQAEEPYPRFDDPDAVVFNDLPVMLYFHSQTPPAGTEIIRPVSTVSSTIATGDRTCRHAGLEGLRKLQRIAVQREANAVVNIRATWDGKQLGDDLVFGCVPEGDRYSLIWEGALARIPEERTDGDIDSPSPAAPADSPEASLRKLQRLYYQGLITREEFLKRKKKILDEI